VIVGSEFAPQIIQTAEEGDPAAAAIVQHAGRSIAENVVAVARRLELLESGFDLVTAGGVFSSRSRLLNESLSEGLGPHLAGVRLVHWDAPPVVGALLLALDQMRPRRLPDAALLASNIGQALEAR
jgi:N-acetylglucosamine kinase-like BadF-type ATPase